MGRDFDYGNALPWFLNMDKLKDYLNSNSNYNVVYSSPSCYTKARNDLGFLETAAQYTGESDMQAARKDLSVKTDDFLPIASLPTSFETGMYSARPGLKGYIRQTYPILKFCQQMSLRSQGKFS